MSHPRVRVSVPVPQNFHPPPRSHLDVVAVHVAGGVAEKAVGDKAVGVHAVDEGVGSLGGGGREYKGDEGGVALSHPPPRGGRASPSPPPPFWHPPCRFRR